MNETLKIVLEVAAWLLAGFVAFHFYKAGSFKLTSPIEKLVEAGMGWVTKIPASLVRVVALLELLGALGIILAPAAVEFLGFGWAANWALAAAAGLSLTMMVAITMHQARKELKYTWKANFSLLIPSLALLLIYAAVL